MQKTFGEYQYLAGNTFTRGTLWEGKDHLLYVDSKGVLFDFRETCRRIDYKNVQAIMLGRSRSWILSLILQLALIIVVSSAAYNGLRYLMRPLGHEMEMFGGFVSIPALLVLLPLFVINLVKGPTCVCKLQTGVQVLTLRPVCRMRGARRTVARIAELCRQHQTPVDADLGAQVDAAAEQPTIYVKKKFTGSSLLLWGLLLLLLGGALAIGEIFVNGKVYFIADLAVNAVAALMLIVAHIRCAKIELPGSLKDVVWAVTANGIASAVLWFCLYITSVTTIAVELVKSGKPPALGNDLMPEVVQWLSSATFANLPAGGWLLIAVGTVNVFLALLGLPSVLRPPAKRALPTSTVAVESVPSSTPQE